MNESRRFSIILLLTSAASVVACGGDNSVTAQAQASATSGTGGSTGGTGASTSGTGGSTGSGSGGTQACPLGSTWSLVDDFVFSPGEHSNPSVIEAGPAGELYASGVVRMGMFRGMVRKSVDGGTTWTSLDALDPVTMQPIGASGIVVDPAGVVFMIGGSGDGRTVWKSDDGGQSFTRIDTYSSNDPMGTPCNTGRIARAPDGTLYTLGSCDVTGWVVRRGDNAGASWSTVSNFLLVAGHRARSADVFVDAMGRVFVSGSAQDMLDVNHWIVRNQGTDGTWTTVDDYQLVVGAHARAAALGGTTRLYALGAAATMPPDFTGSHWIVRTADPVTGAWSTADDHALGTSSAGAIYEDPAGALLVLGTVEDSTSTVGATAVVARRSNDGGASWQVVDTYSYVAGKPSAPTGLTADPAGNVYVTIRGVDSSDAAHWLVRKLACD